MKITSDGIVLEGSDKITAWDQLAPGVYTTFQSAGPFTVAYVRENGASAIKESVKNALLAAELEGRTLEAIYVDTDRGLTPVSQRPGGAALLEDIRANKVHRLIVDRRDRLARTAEELLRMLTLLVRHGVEVRNTDPNEPAFTPDSAELANEVARLVEEA